MSSNQYQNYSVRYWNQDPKINNCFGNSISKTYKARTEQEAIRKAKNKCGSAYFFRLHSVNLT